MKAFRRPHSWCGKFTLAKPTWKMWKAFSTFVHPSQGCVLDFASKGEVVHMLQDICFASKGDSINLFYFCKGFLFTARIISLQNQPSKLLSVKLTLDRVNNKKDIP